MKALPTLYFVKWSNCALCVLSSCFIDSLMTYVLKFITVTDSEIAFTLFTLSSVLF